MSLSIIAAILGAENPINERVSDVFMGDKAGTESYPNEVFTAHVEAVKEKGEAYVDFVDNLRQNPTMKTMYVFFVGQGPEGIYALLQQMGGAGLLEKSKVASAAKIATKTRAERLWFRKIWDELAAEGYDLLSKAFEERLDEYRKRFPEIDAEDVTSLKDLLVVCGKSTLNAGVDKSTEPHTEQECSIALGWRLDQHSAARNGGWDPKKEEYTKAYHERQAKKAAGEDVEEEVEDDDSDE